MTCPDCGLSVTARRALRALAVLALWGWARSRAGGWAAGSCTTCWRDAAEPAADLEALGARRGAGSCRGRDGAAATSPGVSGVPRRRPRRLRRDGRRLDASRGAARRRRGGGGLGRRRRGGRRPQRGLDRRRARHLLAEVESTAPAQRPEWAGSRIRALPPARTHRRDGVRHLARLGPHPRPRRARAALERGVTYFDTAPDYSDAGSETLLGQAMKGRRDKIFLATKFCRPDGHLPNDTPVPEIIAAVEAEPARLQTDHVDLIHIHSCDRVERLMAPNIHEAFDRLKEQGKVRFLGVSTHTPNLEEVANAAIDSGRFDVMMLAYHFGMWPSFGHILEKAKQHDVGIVAMKTLKGARHADLAPFRDDATAYSQAAFRWVLSNPDVSCLVISFSEPQHVDEYLSASGTALRPEDVAAARALRPAGARATTASRTAACASTRAPRACRSTTCCATACTPRLRLGAGGHAPLRPPRADASLCAGCPAPCAGTCPQACRSAPPCWTPTVG